VTEYIKLVDKSLQTRDGYQWTIGKRHRATGKRGQGLCSGEYLHCYESLEQASMMAPFHGVGHYTRALVAEGRCAISDGTKIGCRQLTILREVEPLMLTTEQRIAAAIVMSSRIYRSASWSSWAFAWLSGNDRSYDAAYSAYAAYDSYGAAPGTSITDTVRLVLDTPEDQWASLIEEVTP